MAAQEPDTPPTPTTSLHEVNNMVTLSWSAPSNNGSPITSYRILIRQSDLTTYTEDLANCDGTIVSIVDSRSCQISVQTLMQAPYLLTPGVSVFAKVFASNVMGVSA